MVAPDLKVPKLDFVTLQLGATDAAWIAAAGGPADLKPGIGLYLPIPDVNGKPKPEFDRFELNFVNLGMDFTGKAGQPQPLSALVVDDSLTVREQMRMALERLGIACDQADSAEAAMQLLQHNSYNLAFLDVVMPGTDGYELCRKIKHNSYTRLMPVLMLTSRSSPFDRARGALSGCDSYLTKPITWDTFSHAVDKALMKHFRNDRAQMIARGYRT